MQKKGVFWFQLPREALNTHFSPLYAAISFILVCISMFSYCICLLANAKESGDESANLAIFDNVKSLKVSIYLYHTHTHQIPWGLGQVLEHLDLKIFLHIRRKVSKLANCLLFFLVTSKSPSGMQFLLSDLSWIDHWESSKKSNSLKGKRNIQNNMSMSHYDPKMFRHLLHKRKHWKKRTLSLFWEWELTVIMEIETYCRNTNWKWISAW